MPQIYLTEVLRGLRIKGKSSSKHRARQQKLVSIDAVFKKLLRAVSAFAGFLMRVALDTLDIPSHSFQNAMGRFGLRPGRAKNFPQDITGRAVLGQFTRRGIPEYVVALFDIRPLGRLRSLDGGVQPYLPTETRRRGPERRLDSDSYAEFDEVVVPVSQCGNRGSGRIQIDGDVFELRNLAKNKFHNFHLKLSRGDFVELDNQDLLCGEPIPHILPLDKVTSGGEPEDITVIFVDGLAAEYFSDQPMSNIMPETSKFFLDGHNFPNFRVCAEWTQPSIASFLSGLEPLHNQMWMPNPKHVSSLDSARTLFEHFSSAGYLVSVLGSNARTSPAFEYMRGFDLAFFEKDRSVEQWISKMLEIQEAWPLRSHFTWVSAMEIHAPFSNGIPPLTVQTRMPPRLLGATGHEDKFKSPYAPRSQEKERAYKLALTDLDRKLSRLFSYISERELVRRQTVVLLSDHGQSFLTDDRSLLSQARVRTPFLIRDSTLKPKTDFRPVQATDFCSILSQYTGNKGPQISKEFVNAGGILSGFTLAESIHPGMEYLCSVADEHVSLEFRSTRKVSPSYKLPDELELEVIGRPEVQSVAGISIDDLKTLLEARLHKNKLRPR